MEEFKKIFANKYVKLGIAILVIIILILAYFKIKKLFGRSNRITREARNEYQNRELSFSESEYLSMAENLFWAMDGWGTHEDTIYNTLKKLKTSDDWYKLVDVYGIRKHSRSAAAGFSSFTGNLIESLGNELSGSERQKVSDILKLIGVTF